jgi:RHS repeat-associated protein
VNSYDEQGRAYRSQVFNIDQTNGTSGLADAQILALPNLATNTFYNNRGDAIAVFNPGGLVTKSIFDGAGRVTEQYVTDGGTVNNSNVQQMDWTHASSVSSDAVLQQTDFTYDGDGNTILTATHLRFHNDATSSTGALGSPTSGIGARVYFLADYYDAADRLTDDVNVGTNGGTSYTRPGTVPSRSDTVLVNHTDFDAAGNVADTIDPRGIENQFTHDMLGRKTQETDGASGPASSGQSQTNYTYDGDGNVLTMQAVFPGTSTPSQMTQYVYGVGTNVGADLFSKDLLAKVEYPTKSGPSAGQPSSAPSDDVSYAYNLQGEITSMQDQNVNIHTYSRDVLGRVTLDAVTTLGSGVNGSILALGFKYTALGLPYQQTSYSDSSGATVVNQVQDAYNGYGQIVTQYQEHNGAVNTSSSLKVQYAYDQSNNDSRLVSTTYPNGRIVDYAYGTLSEPITSISSSGTTATATLAGSDHLSVGDKILITGSATSQYDGTFPVASTSASSFTFTLSQSYSGSDSSPDISALDTSFDPLDNAISRPAALIDHGGSAADFLQRDTYVGLSTVVQANDSSTYATGAPALSYINRGQGQVNTDGGDSYTGLDRFGRVIDQYWFNVNGTTDRFQYGYDRDGNVLYKNNLKNSGFSELYHANSGSPGDNNGAYDNLNEIPGFRRGTLSSSGNNGSSLDTVSTLNSNADSSQSFTMDAVGNITGVTTDGTGQTNTVNSQNEETTAGSNTLGFDSNGNTTTDDQGHTLVYDAWNRLVVVKSGATTLANYSYDAAGNRIQQTENSATTDFYFSSSGQVLEERQGSTVTDQYLWGLMDVNDLILRDDNSVSGNLGKSGSGLGERLFVQQDANWNVTALIKLTTVAERFVYTPYGIRTVLSSAWSVVSDSFNWLYGFQGGRRDPVSGFIRFGVRDYSATLMRWLQRDPTGYRGILNLYAALNDSPVTVIDPTGTDGYPLQPPSGDHNVYGGSGDTSDSGLPSFLPPELQQKIADFLKDQKNKNDPNAPRFFPPGPPFWDQSPTQPNFPNLSGGLHGLGGYLDVGKNWQCLHSHDLRFYLQLDAHAGVGIGRPFNGYYSIGAFIGHDNGRARWGVGGGVAIDPSPGPNKKPLVGGFGGFYEY